MNNLFEILEGSTAKIEDLEAMCEETFTTIKKPWLGSNLECSQAVVMLCASPEAQSMFAHYHPEDYQSFWDAVSVFQGLWVKKRTCPNNACVLNAMRASVVNVAAVWDNIFDPEDEDEPEEVDHE